MPIAPIKGGIMSYMFKLVFGNGEVEEFDDIFDSEEDATEAASYAAACQREGAELEHMSNPGDYPDDEVDVDYEVFEA